MKALDLKPIKHYCFEISKRNSEYKKQNGIDCFEGNEETFKNSEQTIKLILKTTTNQ